MQLKTTGVLEKPHDSKSTETLDQIKSNSKLETYENEYVANQDQTELESEGGKPLKNSNKSAVASSRQSVLYQDEMQSKNEGGTPGDKSVAKTDKIKLL